MPMIKLTPEMIEEGRAIRRELQRVFRLRKKKENGDVFK